MKKLSLLILFLTVAASAQVPIATQVRIMKAEEARQYDAALETLLKDRNEKVRERAALAAGRIGDERAVAVLVKMLNDASPRVKRMAAFALGEIESVKAADAIVKAIGETGRAQLPGEAGGVDRSRLVEAAGKIAAANAKHTSAKDLAAAITFTLEAELAKRRWDKETILLGLTAALRAKPEKADDTVRKFLAFTDADIVATALNTLTRLRAKNSNRDARDLLATHVHAVVRANAARLLGPAEDREAVDLLIKAATADSDSRVRVSAIRSLAALKDAKAADKLTEAGEILLLSHSHSKIVDQVQKNELLEIATALGRLLADTKNERALRFLDGFIDADQMRSAEPLIARLRIAPGKFNGSKVSDKFDWHKADTLAQVIAEIPSLKAEGDAADLQKNGAAMARELMQGINRESSKDKKLLLAYPAALRAYAAFKPADLPEVLRDSLKHSDPFVRAAAAELIGELPTGKESVEALKLAYSAAITTDLKDNDAQIAILSALAKLDKDAAVEVFDLAMASPDYVVRRNVADLIRQNNLATRLPGFEEKIEPVGKHQPRFNTKLGQVLNTELDYRRAATRRNGAVKAVLTTDKGTFTIDLLPQDAPLTVDNFIKLARARYFNGLEVHRVVPNFVMQDGDPRGDGNGGPGWSIRCETNMLPYERGAVGMALSGKDTGGSQWFVTHSPQPHLDGGYTVFGKVNDAGMNVVDSIVRGDKILSVRIIEGASTQRSRRTQRRRN